jgi:hypothetical protein
VGCLVFAQYHVVTHEQLARQGNGVVYRLVTAVTAGTVCSRWFGASSQLALRWSLRTSLEWLVVADVRGANAS